MAIEQSTQLLRDAQALSKDNSEEAQQLHAIGVLTVLLKQAEEDKTELLDALRSLADTSETLPAGRRGSGTMTESAIRKARDAVKRAGG